MCVWRCVRASVLCSTYAVVLWPPVWCHVSDIWFLLFSVRSVVWMVRWCVIQKLWRCVQYEYYGAVLCECCGAALYECCGVVVYERCGVVLYGCCGVVLCECCRVAFYEYCGVVLRECCGAVLYECCVVVLSESCSAVLYRDVCYCVAWLLWCCVVWMLWCCVWLLWCCLVWMLWCCVAWILLWCVVFVRMPFSVFLWWVNMNADEVCCMNVTVLCCCMEAMVFCWNVWMLWCCINAVVLCCMNAVVILCRCLVWMRRCRLVWRLRCCYMNVDESEDWRICWQQTWSLTKLCSQIFPCELRALTWAKRSIELVGTHYGNVYYDTGFHNTWCWHCVCFTGNKKAKSSLNRISVENLTSILACGKVAFSAPDCFQWHWRNSTNNCEVVVWTSATAVSHCWVYDLLMTFCFLLRCYTFRWSSPDGGCTGNLFEGGRFGTKCFQQ